MSPVAHFVSLIYGLLLGDPGNLASEPVDLGATYGRDV
jgi:hypothetical protein